MSPPLKPVSQRQLSPLGTLVLQLLAPLHTYASTNLVILPRSLMFELSIVQQCTHKLPVVLDCHTESNVATGYNEMLAYITYSVLLRSMWHKCCFPSVGWSSMM